MRNMSKSQTDPSYKEILEYIEASSNVIDSQKAALEGLQKKASEYEAKIRDLQEAVRRERDLVSKLSKKAEETSVKNSASVGWGRGEQSGTSGTKMRDSDRKLLTRLGIPSN
jgi:uncharacterized protein involved in exopolysaccharide biosynthesis